LAYIISHYGFLQQNNTFVTDFTSKRFFPRMHLHVPLQIASLKESSAAYFTFVSLIFLGNIIHYIQNKMFTHNISIQIFMTW